MSARTASAHVRPSLVGRTWAPIQRQAEWASRIGDDEGIEEGDKMHRQWHTSYGAKDKRPWTC